MEKVSVLGIHNLIVQNQQPWRQTLLKVVLYKFDFIVYCT